VFAIIKEAGINTTLDNINSISPTIKLPIEEEQNNKITFLDLKVTRTIEKTLTYNSFR
jgi:hypothetical protein